MKEIFDFPNVTPKAIVRAFVAVPVVLTFCFILIWVTVTAFQDHAQVVITTIMGAFSFVAGYYFGNRDSDNKRADGRAEPTDREELS